ELVAGDCVAGGPCIAVAGRLVNVPEPELANVRVYMNDVNITSSLRTDAATRRFNILISPDDTQSNALLEGRNVLTLEIYMSGLRRATSTVEIFKFTHAAPAVGDFLIDQDSTNPKYTEGSVPGTYFTSERTVTFYGSMTNVDEISLRVLRTEDDGEQVTLYELYRDPTDSGSFARQVGTVANPISNAVLFDNDTFSRTS